MSLQGKKLLSMGGSGLICDIINTAKGLGVITIVTNWYKEEESYIKRLADKSFRISSTDTDGIVKLIKNEGIDGVLTGFSDSNLPYYQRVCEKAQLPCYATYKQIEITTNKRKFKDLCNIFEVPVVEEFSFDKSFMNNKLLRIKYPIIIKPVDNSGGKGIKICYNESELKEAYETAITFSETKSVIVESYMTNREVSIFYVIFDGEIYLTLMGNRHTKHNQTGIIPLPVAYDFPSQYLTSYQHNLNDKVIEMLKSIGMMNGMLFIQSFIEDSECIFYEMGYRLTGSLEYKILEKICGYNPLKMMICHALTGRMLLKDEVIRINPNLNQVACNITFLTKPGHIGKIIGIDKVLSFPEVIDAVSSYNEGDIVPESAVGTLEQVVLRVFALAASKKKLAYVMDKIHNSIEVYSVNGDNMLLEKFNTSELMNDYEMTI